MVAWACSIPAPRRSLSHLQLARLSILPTGNLPARRGPPWDAYPTRPGSGDPRDGRSSSPPRSGRAGHPERCPWPWREVGIALSSRGAWPGWGCPRAGRVWGTWTLCFSKTGGGGGGLGTLPEVKRLVGACWGRGSGERDPSLLFPGSELGPQRCSASRIVANCCNGGAERAWLAGVT